MLFRCKLLSTGCETCGSDRFSVSMVMDGSHLHTKAFIKIGKMECALLRTCKELI